MKNALLFWGGWDGHKPQRTAELLAEQLQQHGFATTLSDSLEVLTDADALRRYSLIVPCWTMGDLTKDQGLGLQNAIKAGAGLGGIHGGMGDAFRGNIDYEWMVGGHFVGHPYIGKYEIRIINIDHPITEGVPPVFDYESEQYYLMIDPSIEILAETTYEFEGRKITMPVAWTKHWGLGRIFYASYGHQPEEFGRFPSALALATRGLLWASGSL